MLLKRFFRGSDFSFSYIKKPFASYVENIAGEVDVIKTTIKNYVNDLISSIKEKCAEVMQTIFKEFGLSDSILQGGVGGIGGSGGGGGGTAGGTGTTMGSSATGEASSMLGSTMGSVMTVVGYVYMAYVIANMIVQIAYACTEDEFALVAQRDQKNCHYIGSYCKSKVLGACIEKREVYCCFKSPLARIMNEQIRLQGDILGEEYDGFGTPKNPKCTGCLWTRSIGLIGRASICRSGLRCCASQEICPPMKPSIWRASLAREASSTWTATGSTRLIA